MAENPGLLGRITSSLKSLYENTIGMVINSIFKKKYRILFLGIDNAGKTTLIHKLKTGVVNIFNPTMNPRQEEVDIGNMTTYIQDLGGHEAARLLWEDYFYSCDGVVFIVDVSDSTRFDVVKKSYMTCLKKCEENKIPIVVLFNKTDILEKEGISLDDENNFAAICSETGIYEDLGGKVPVKINCVSILNENFTNENCNTIMSFVWLERFITQVQNKSDL